MNSVVSVTAIPLGQAGPHTPFIGQSRYVERCGFPARLAALVAHHSAARIEAEVRGVVGDLARWRLEASPVTEALAYADMTTGPCGQRFTVEERISEILTRYPPEHVVHRTIRRSAPILRAYVGRVEGRLAAVEAGQLT